MKAPFAMVPLPPERSRKKPRRAGLTMVVDHGIALGEQADLLALGGAYLDLAKIKTGTARLYPERLLRAKLARYRRHRVQPFLGGQFHEYVFATQGSRALGAFYREALRLGFEAIEISDNVVPLTPPQRRAQIGAARAAGLTVYGEAGSKETLSNPGLLVRQAERDDRASRPVDPGGAQVRRRGAKEAPHRGARPRRQPRERPARRAHRSRNLARRPRRRQPAPVSRANALKWPC
jgi:phosphosulfolactate synthase (CoM biosynthesis protein A)